MTCTYVQARTPNACKCSGFIPVLSVSTVTKITSKLCNTEISGLGNKAGEEVHPRGALDDMLRYQKKMSFSFFLLVFFFFFFFG